MIFKTKEKGQTRSSGIQYNIRNSILLLSLLLNILIISWLIKSYLELFSKQIHQLLFLPNTFFSRLYICYCFISLWWCHLAFDRWVVNHFVGVICCIEWVNRCFLTYYIQFHSINTFQYHNSPWLTQFTQLVFKRNFSFKIQQSFIIVYFQWFCFKRSLRR